VRVTFSWGTDIDTAALDVQATLEDEINELPDDIVRPRVSKFDVASYPVVLLGISSSLDPVELTELVENQVRYRFARIPGVAQVDLWGGFNREVRVELDPAASRRGLPLDGCCGRSGTRTSTCRRARSRRAATRSRCAPRRSSTVARPDPRHRDRHARGAPGHASARSPTVLDTYEKLTAHRARQRRARDPGGHPQAGGRQHRRGLPGVLRVDRQVNAAFPQLGRAGDQPGELHRAVDRERGARCCTAAGLACSCCSSSCGTSAAPW
jgi:hypothetical protein